MGSEQSTQANPQLRRGKSVPNPESTSDESPTRCISPGPSVCSDSDLPYISYTVNRPIGESPRTITKPSQLYKGKSLEQSSSRKFSQSTISPKKSSKAHDIVVVKAAAAHYSPDKDPDLLKLKNIPMFLPIMRGTLNLPPRVRDPEVLERLDPLGLFNLCARYQHHLNVCAQSIAEEQNALCTNIEAETNKLLAAAVERQKKFAKFGEELNQVHEISEMLNKCQTQLTDILESLETLNNMLPVKDRLETFVWTTG